MNSSIDYIPPLPITVILAGVGVIAVLLLVARLVAGPGAELAKRTGLIVVRSAVILLLLVLFLNPVAVKESPGTLERGEVFYLLDTSASMGIGSERTRFNDMLRFIDSAGQQVRSPSAAEVKLFRFGHRLSSLDGLEGSSANADSVADAADLATPVNYTPAPGIVPSDTDTRMQLALQQVISRFSRSPPGAVILFSDGRARDAEGVEAIAKHFAELKVPIHVVPAGDTSLGGDIAIVAAVVPPVVRKESEVEVQVFLRSYGYDGRRVEVMLSNVDAAGVPTRQLAPPQPVTLASGVQPVSLRFRAAADTRNLMVSIPVQEGEVASRNNAIEAEIDIDRTKIRVLYVEGSRQAPRVTRRGEELVTRGPYSELHDALTADRDIECVVITAAYGDTRRVNAAGDISNLRGFPATQAELLAYDCLILSGVRRDYFSDEQLAWMHRWIGQRGGGLCMLGGPESFGSGGWDNGLMEEMLPVTIGSNADWNPATEIAAEVTAEASGHPLWHLVSDADRNREIQQTLPPFEGMNEGLVPKASLSDVLATAEVNRSASVFGGSNNLGFRVVQPAPAEDAAEQNTPKQIPAVVVGRYGKGRTLAMPMAVTAPWANAFLNNWGVGDNRYYAKFWRNAVYWLTENSSIGRRRLVADYDRRYYKPGDSILLRARAYDESAAQTQSYRLVAMIEPQSPDFDFESIYSPVRWPVGVPRESGEDGPLIAWGEEFPLPKLTAQTAGPLGASENGYGIELQIADVLPGGSAGEGLRIELTAYEDFTQVDSTSLEIHVLHDPFEQKNPFPDHDLMARVAELSGGKVLKDAGELTDILEDQPVTVGPPEVRRSPLWSNWWLWGAIVGLLTVEWFWRRNVGLA